MSITHRVQSAKGTMRCADAWPVEISICNTVGCSSAAACSLRTAGTACKGAGCKHATRDSSPQRSSCDASRLTRQFQHRTSSCTSHKCEVPSFRMTPVVIDSSGWRKLFVTTMGSPTCRPGPVIARARSRCAIPSPRRRNSDSSPRIRRDGSTSNTSARPMGISSSVRAPPDSNRR